MKSITSALEMSPGSAVSSDPGDEEEEEEEDIEESHSQAALDATGASQVSVPDETEYDEVFEDSNIKIEKWEDEEDDREDEDEEEEEEEDYSRENDDKWEDDEDDVSDNVKTSEKQREGEGEVERSVKYEEPERPKFASFAGTSHSFHLVLSSCLFLSCSVLSLASAALVLSLCCLFADFLLLLLFLFRACETISLVYVSVVCVCCISFLQS
jgi:archaellum component FlaD/FlaE